MIFSQRALYIEGESLANKTNRSASLKSEAPFKGHEVRPQHQCVPLSESSSVMAAVLRMSQESSVRKSGRRRGTITSCAGYSCAVRTFVARVRTASCCQPVLRAHKLAPRRHGVRAAGAAPSPATRAARRRCSPTVRGGVTTLARLPARVTRNPTLSATCGSR